MRPNILRSVLKKELIDHLRDRRSVFSAFLVPLLGPVMFTIMFTTMATWMRTDKPIELPVVGREHAQSLMRFLERSGVVLSDAPADHEAKVSAGDLDCVLKVPSEYGESFSAGKSAHLELIVDHSHTSASHTVTRVRKLIQSYSSIIGAERLLARGVSPELVATIKLDERDLATPEGMAARVLELIPMFIIFAAFIGGMHVAIDTTAGERERGSLEPLLVNPVARSWLVAGKWLATAAVAIVASGICIGAFMFAVHHVPLHDLGVKARFDGQEAGMMALAAVPLACFSSALQMLIATYARSFKEAQTYLQVLQLVPMIPGIVMTLNPIQTKVWMFVVPLLSQTLLIEEVMRGTASVMPFLLALAGCAAGTVLCLIATTRLLRDEKIIFGR
jgi:sodium transport system permease protein